MNVIGKDLNYAISLLSKNEVIAIPTETVYGLAGNATNLHAVTKIFTIKERPQFDPLIVHVAKFEAAAPFLKQIPPAAVELAQLFMPGPLTLLLEKSHLIPDLVTAGSDLVAIRVPNHPMTLKLLTALPFPLAAPSANPFGYISPTTPQHVIAQLGQKIPYVLDGGPCQIGIESTIVGFDGEETVIYRKGGLAIEKISAILDTPVKVRAHSSSNPKSPGMLKQHYAPNRQFIVGNIPELLNQHADKKVAILSFCKTYDAKNLVAQIVLSPTENLEEAARNLFSSMRKLDQLDADIIIAEWLPESGLGRAINDRLKRASAR